MDNNILKKSLNSGFAGAGAMSINVMSLMWLRTTVNYQYKYGTSTTCALKTLYKEGGIPRFYRGLLPALIQGPLSRFGDTAANSAVVAYWDVNDTTKNMPTILKTFSASSAAALFRIALMPIDSVKTTMQVNGTLRPLISNLCTKGPQVLWYGSIGASTATFVGHYPWFLTYNILNENIPKYDKNDHLGMYLSRNAFIGFNASVMSDTISNSIRVLKTCKQTATDSTTYHQVFTDIIRKDGVNGLLFRGLSTKILSNGLQGLIFNVLWKLGQDYLENVY